MRRDVLTAALALLAAGGSAARMAPPIGFAPRGATLLLRRAARAGRGPRMLDAFVVERLASVKETYEELGAQMADPEVQADLDRLLKVTKDRAALEETVHAYDSYLSLTSALDDAKELFAESAGDAEMREMAREEVREVEAELEALDGKIKVLLLPKDPNDEKNVMFEIRAGTGGDEASIWASDLLKLYSKYAESQGWTVRTVSFSDTESGGCREATVEIKGDAVYSKLKFEAGVHRVQARPASPSSRDVVSLCPVVGAVWH